MHDKCKELTDAIKIGVVIIDKNFKIVDVNKEILLKGGVTKSALIGTDFLTWFPEDRRNEIKKILEDTLSGKTAWGKGSFKIYSQRLKKFLTVDLRVRRLRDNLVVTIIDKSWLYKTLGKLNIIQTAVEHMREGLVVTDSEGTIIYVNPGFTEMTGYSFEEVIGKNPRILKSGKQDRKFYENMWNTILSGNVWKGQLINRRKDGKLYWEEMTIVPIKDNKGNVSNFVAVKRDITDRKELEIEIEKREEYYRKIFTMSRDGIFIETTDGKLVDVNEAGAAMLGYTREELLKSGLEAIIPEDERKKLPSLLRELKEKGEVRVEVFNKHKKGYLVPLELSLGLLKMDKKDMVIVIARDLSLRNEMEKKYRILVQMAFDAIILINKEGKVEYWNPAAERMFGYTQNEVLHKPFWEFIVPPRYLNSVPNIIKKGFSRKDFHLTTLEVEAKRKDGKIIPIEHRASLFNIGGEKYALAMIRDITERKEMERKIKRHLDMLSSVQRFSLNLGSVTDLRELSQKAYKEIKKLMPLESFTIGFVDWEKGTIRYELIMHKGKNLGPIEIQLDTKNSLSGWIVVNKKPLLIKDLEKEKDSLPSKWFKISDLPRSWIGVPLIYKDRVVGVLILQSFSPNTYSEEDVEFLKTLGAQLSLAIINSQLYTKLKLSEEKYRNIIESAIVGVLIVSLKGEIKFSNKKMAEMIGYTPEELVGKSIFDLTTAEGKKIFERELKKRGESLRTYYENVFITKEGEKRDVLINASPLHDEKGNITGSVGIVVDITDRKKMEEHLRLEKERYEELFESMANIVVLIQNGKIIYINKSFEASTGYRAEEVINRPFIQFVHPDMRDIVLTNYRRRMRGENAPKQYVIKILSKEGKERWMDVRTTLISWNGGKADLLSMVDITYMKEMEDKAMAVDEVARRLKMANTRDEIYEITIDNLYRVLNLYNSAILELRGDELVMVKTRGYTNTNFRIKIDSKKGITPWVVRNNLPYYCPNTDEDELYIEGVKGAKCEYATPISIDNKIYGVLDVQKKEPHSISEDDINLIDMLANNMAVALRGLESLKELERAKNLQELMLHIVSHDLKNPLAVLSGYVDIMREDFNPEYLDAMQRAIEEASNIIEKARLFSKLGAGKIEQERELINLRKMIEKSASLLSHKYPEGKVKIEMGDIEIYAFPLIEEVFVNLIDNAFKYGASEVIITAKENKNVEIRVADNGPGVPDEKKKSIFEAFETLSTMKGSGLGLSIVKMIVELHNGKIWVEDNKPKGSVFVMQLPKD